MTVQGQCSPSAVCITELRVVKLPVQYQETCIPRRGSAVSFGSFRECLPTLAPRRLQLPLLGLLAGLQIAIAFADGWLLFSFGQPQTKLRPTRIRVIVQSVCAGVTALRVLTSAVL